MQIDLSSRIKQAKSHFSHSSHLMGNWQPLGPTYPFLNEYISSCIATLIMAIILYYTMSSLSYYYFYVYKKKVYTPLRQHLIKHKELYYHDIKWSLLNIIGQVPLVVLIKMGYPYFSKIQYQWQFRPQMVLFFIFHYVYDEFLTFWAHKLLHTPFLYKHLHYIHHKSRSITPFTGFAFHPLDAFMQAVPALTSCYLVPLPINFVLFHSLITSMWAISIHDNINMIPFKGILFAGSHTIHHETWGELYNYGKFTSICDMVYGSYCDPNQITGYGYQQGQGFKVVIRAFNKYWERIVPDVGRESIQRIRGLVKRENQEYENKNKFKNQ